MSPEQFIASSPATTCVVALTWLLTRDDALVVQRALCRERRMALPITAVPGAIWVGPTSRPDVPGCSNCLRTRLDAGPRDAPLCRVRLSSACESRLAEVVSTELAGALSGTPDLVCRAIRIDRRRATVSVHPLLPHGACSRCGPIMASAALSPGTSGPPTLAFVDALTDLKLGIVRDVRMLSPRPRERACGPVVAVGRVRTNAPARGRPTSIPVFGKGWDRAECVSSLLGEGLERYAEASSEQGARWTRVDRFLNGDGPCEDAAPRGDGGAGSALGITRRSAIETAMLEAFERDAFSVAWQAGRWGPAPDPRDHPSAEVRAMVTEFSRLGIAAHCRSLPSDHGVPVVMAMLVDQSASSGTPAFALGLAAGRSQAAAGARALMEAGQVRRTLCWLLNGRRCANRASALRTDPLAVVTPLDHALAYVFPEALGRLTGIIEAAGREPWDDGEVDVLGTGLAWSRRSRAPLVTADLTTPEIRALGYWVVSVASDSLEPLRWGVPSGQASERVVAACRCAQAEGCVPRPSPVWPHPFA